MTFDLTRIRLYRTRAAYRSIILNTAARKAGGPNGASKEDQLEYTTCKKCGFHHSSELRNCTEELKTAKLELEFTEGQWTLLVQFARVRNTTPALLVKELLYEHLSGFVHGIREGLNQAHQEIDAYTLKQ